jgi:hypothetical protein
MTPLDATNDDLLTFLARKKKTEVYRCSTDLEILARERSKAGYLLAIYIMFAVVASYQIGARASGLGFVIPVLFIGAWLLMRRQRRLDDFIVLEMTRKMER